jgi:hypothetical protein
MGTCLINIAQIAIFRGGGMANHQEAESYVEAFLGASRRAEDLGQCVSSYGLIVIGLYHAEQ